MLTAFAVAVVVAVSLASKAVGTSFPVMVCLCRIVLFMAEF